MSIPDSHAPDRVLMDIMVPVVALVIHEAYGHRRLRDFAETFRHRFFAIERVLGNHDDDIGDVLQYMLHVPSRAIGFPSLRNIVFFVKSWILQLAFLKDYTGSNMPTLTLIMQLRKAS